MDEIGKLLPALFTRQIRCGEPRLLEILLPLWPRVVGKLMAQHSRPALFASGVLTLEADCAAWGTQLRHLTQEVRVGINTYLGQPMVKKLRIRTVNHLGLFSPSRHSRRTAPPAPRLREETMDTAGIADLEIAAALANSYAKYFNRPRS